VTPHEDGSATIAERVWFSKRLLDLGRNAPRKGNLDFLLTRKAVETRMRHMGKGIRLIKHELRGEQDGSKESRATFRIANLADLQYMSPFPRDPRYPFRTRAQARLFVIRSGGHRGRQRAGNLGVRFAPVPNGRPKPPAKQRPKDAPRPPGPTPEELQILRELRPVFRDLMKGLKLRLTFESYAPIHTVIGWRNRRARTKEFDLIHFDAAEAMDAHDYPFLESEELMLDLLRGRLNSDEFERHLEGWATNHHLPILHDRVTITFPPSRPLFKAYVEGVVLRCPYRPPGPEGRRLEDDGQVRAGGLERPITRPAVNSPPPCRCACRRRRGIPEGS
jgi:hypothetical protein